MQRCFGSHAFNTKCYQLKCFKYSSPSPRPLRLYVWWSGWRGFRWRPSPALITLFPLTGAQMKCICQKRRNWDSLSAVWYCLHSFLSKQETATQSGESAYADRGDKFFMSTFHPKADKKEDRGKVVIKQKMESTEWKMALKMKFLSGCFASQASFNSLTSMHIAGIIVLHAVC